MNECILEDRIAQQFFKKETTVEQKQDTGEFGVTNRTIETLNERLSKWAASDYMHRSYECVGLRRFVICAGDSDESRGKVGFAETLDALRFHATVSSRNYSLETTTAFQKEIPGGPASQLNWGPHNPDVKKLVKRAGANLTDHTGIERPGLFTSMAVAQDMAIALLWKDKLWEVCYVGTIAESQFQMKTIVFMTHPLLEGYFVITEHETFRGVRDGK